MIVLNIAKIIGKPRHLYTGLLTHKDSIFNLVITTSKRSLLILLALSLSFFPSPAMALDEGFYSGNDILYYNPDVTCAPVTDSIDTITPAGTGSNIKVTLAQANIKKDYRSASQAARYRDAMDLFSPRNPDFVTLNEIHTPDNQMKYKNYEVFGKQHPNAASVEDEGVRIAWDKDRWKKIEGGIEMIHPSTPSNDIWERDRYAIWGVFQNNESGATISVISTHWNVGSEKRPAKAKVAGKNMNALAKTLLGKGPVLIGGDFNFPIKDFGQSHSPAQAFKPLDLVSAFSKPEDKDVNIDTIFYPKQFTLTKKQTYSKSKTSPISDHPFIIASFNGAGGASVTDNNGCVCSTSKLSNTLVGDDNQEKVFNYFIQKGLSDVQAAGIIGNMSVESGFDPENVQNDTADAKKYGERTKNPKPLTAGWGLIQWTPGSKIIKAAEDAGLKDEPIYELSTQLDLVWAHLQNAPVVTKSFSIADFKKITDVEEAVRYFEDKIEGAGEPNYPDRYMAARLALDQFKGLLSTSPASTISSDVADCGDVDYGAAAGNAVQTALNYAWPDYRPKGSKDALTLKPSYKKAVDEAVKKGGYVGGEDYRGVDCGVFITLTMKNSGVDPDYGNGGNTTIQLAYLESSSKYKEIKSPTSADMVPGAIAVKSGDGAIGHTYMYVGKNPGFETAIASASLGGRAPMAGMELAADPEYRWFILKDA